VILLKNYIIYIFGCSGCAGTSNKTTPMGLVKIRNCICIAQTDWKRTADTVLLSTRSAAHFPSEDRHSVITSNRTAQLKTCAQS